MGKWVNNFRVQTAFPERETEIERRERDFEAGREKFCRSHLCWAPGETRKTQKGPLATKTGVALEEGRSRVEGLELWPSALARSERTPGRRLSGGRRVQRFPAREERGSDSTLPRWSQPARLRARARLSLRSGNRVLAPKTSHPSPALSVFLLNAPIDNGWQLPALHTQVRPASPLCPTQCPSISVLCYQSLANLPCGRRGLCGAREETEDSELTIISPAAAVQGALGRSRALSTGPQGAVLGEPASQSSTGWERARVGL